MKFAVFFVVIFRVKFLGVLNILYEVMGEI